MNELKNWNTNYAMGERITGMNISNEGGKPNRKNKII